MRPKHPRRGTWVLSVSLAVLGLTLPTQRAHAYAGMGAALCHVLGGAWVIASGLVDLGFSVNAIAYGVRTPAYPPREVSQAQLGLMVPQVALSAVLWPTLGAGCKDSGKYMPILYFGVPLAWSLALIGHGAWALDASNRDAAALAGAMPALSIRVPLPSLAR